MARRTRRRQPLRECGLFAAAAAVSLVMLASAAGGPDRPAEEPAAVYAQLADNTVVRTDGDLATWRARRIAPAPGEIISVGHTLALSRDRRTLWSLVRSAGLLVGLDPASLEVRRSLRLPHGWSVRALAVGSVSGRIWVAYNLVFPSPSTSRHDSLRSARLAVFDPSGRRRLADVLLRPHGRRSWLVWSLALSTDETRAYVSYHGSDTTGLDTVEVAGTQLSRCADGSPGDPGGCWTRPHGGVLATKGAVLTATGSPAIAEFTPEGTVRRRLDTGLEGNHLMSFAVTTAGDRLYAVGSCGYRPGFAALDLATAERLTLVLGGALCGEAIAAAGSRAIVGVTALPVPDPRRRGKLVVLDAASGHVVRQRNTSSEATALLVAR